MTLAGIEAAGIGGIRNGIDFVKLVSLLNTADPQVREGAIKALAKIRGKDATDAIMRCLNDPSPKVRTTACKVLGQMRAHAAKAGLYDTLTDEDPVVCCSAAEALGIMGDKTGLSRVKKLVSASGDHQWRALRCLNLLTAKEFEISNKGLRDAIKWIKSNRRRLFPF